MSRQNDGSGALIGAVFWTFAIARIVSGLSGYGYWLSFGMVLGAYVAIGLSVSVAAYILKRAEARRPCKHGVKAGKAGGCQSCADDEQLQLAQAKAYHADRERKKGIADIASALKQTELSKLRSRWLGRAEHYFQMAPRQFENAIAELFRHLGYVVKQTPYSNDRGKDAVAWKAEKKYLIECKRYEATNTIGRRDLQIFVAAMKEEAAEEGFYINTGRFARTAHEYAAKNHIHLIDRSEFPALVNKAFPVAEDISKADVMCLECGVVETLPVAESPSSCSCRNGHAIKNEITSGLIRESSFLPENVCQRCGSEMRLVRDRFLGCTKYPRCRFTRRYKPPIKNTSLDVAKRSVVQ